MKDKSRRDYTLSPSPRGPTNGVHFNYALGRWVDPPQRLSTNLNRCSSNTRAPTAMQPHGKFWRRTGRSCARLSRGPPRGCAATEDLLQFLLGSPRNECFAEVKSANIPSSVVARRKMGFPALSECRGRDRKRSSREALREAAERAWEEHTTSSDCSPCSSDAEIPDRILRH